ncbi:type VII secretion protein EccB [Streptomyces sp. NPDC051940]|uniref:type VII secretion protein EccB n=1 Tax=Streptomyces sp. NPDC051940 TaxID=3155675 RepID=UPI00343A78C0
MASRRDELNAYTFAKRRLVGQFLQPNPTGTEEGAPKPLRGVVPGMIVAVVVLAVFGAIGIFKPKAPGDWDAAEQNIIRAGGSSSFYVVLKTNGKPQLHEVLNLASARLLLAPGADIVDVDEDILDKSDLPRGATLGIQNAPDRLPSADEVGRKKRWAVCQRPTDSGRAVQKAAFVLDDREAGRLGGKEKLAGGDVLYVQGPDDQRYLVDATGTKYPFRGAGETLESLLRPIVGAGTKPQRVSYEWLKTLHPGDEIYFPDVEGLSQPADVDADGLEADRRRVGMVLSANSGADEDFFVVLRDRIAPVSDFMADLLLNNPAAAQSLGQDGKPVQVSTGAIAPSDEPFGGTLKWPTAEANPVNEASTQPGSRNSICNVLSDVAGGNRAVLFTWAGTRFPAQLAIGSASVYVTPGTGQLYRQSSGTSTDTGSFFLVTDKGLRYALQSNEDGQEDACGLGTADAARKKGETAGEQNSAQKRLNYEGVEAAPVPEEWSDFLPTGPRLSTADACQPQNQ